MNTIFSINGIKKSALELGVVDTKIIKRCSGLDEVKITLASPNFSENFAIGKDIEIFANGVRKFVGKITKTPISLAGKAFEASIIAYNAWHELDEIVYQQKWVRMSNNLIGDFFRSKVVLGQNNLAEKINVGEQIKDIVEYAINSGANFKIGTIDIDAPMLLDETRDLSCAQAILRVLKWSPNAVAFFDYSQNGLPILNVQKRTSLENICVDTSLDSVLKVSITPRPDLSLEGVSIKYEQENIINSKSTLVVSEENYPENISSNSKKVLVISVDLDGRKASCNSYKIVCQTINLSSANWWREHIPSISDSDIEILETSISSNACPRELVDGTIPSSLNFEKQYATAKAKIKYIKTDGTICVKNIATRILTTNAQTGTYSVWHTTQLPEEKPEGLAKAIYDASATLLYDGSITLVGGIEKEFIGKSISVNAQNRSDWLAINSTAVFVEENISTEKTSIKFGTPKHLYPNQIVELFRISRNRKITDSSTMRNSAQNNSLARDMTTQQPIDNGTEGDAYYSRLIITSEFENENVSKKIDINSNDIDENETAQMKKVYLCHNGYLASAKILMTEPLIENESQ